MNVKRIDSKDENVSKYVFDFGNAVAEAVLYKYPTYEERTVICCSTMSGCPVGCRFCGAGDNFVRSLTAQEIIDQVRYVLGDRKVDAAKIKRMQIMFMSMGEPMLNFIELQNAILDLRFMYPQAALLISTSGPNSKWWRQLRVLSANVPQVGLQFSVHESTDEARNKLIPLRGKLTLAEIADEGEKWFVATKRKPFFNYCAHENNTSWEDVERLRALFLPHFWECTVSVVCERDESVAAANIRQRKLATDFMQKMTSAGFSTRCFDPAGQDDIGGGCGQLWYVQDWMKNHPDLAKPSVGRTFPIVHAPRAIELKA